jgi:hypothetical protein
MNENLTPIAVGTRVKVAKGCNNLGIIKGSHARVTEVMPMGPEFSHEVRITLMLLSGSKAGKSQMLWVRHPNRLADLTINANNGNPLNKVQLVRA